MELRARNIPPTLHPDVRMEDIAPRNSDPSAPRSWSRAISSLVHTLFWLAFAGYLWYRGNVAHIMLFDPRVNKPALYLGYATASAVFGAYLYFTVMIAPTMKDIPDNAFERVAPRTIYTATACAVISFISFTIAAWPVWRFTSIVLVSVTYIAVMFAPNLVPNF